MESNILILSKNKTRQTIPGLSKNNLGGKMKRTTILGICLTAFVAIAAWAPNVLAYSGYYDTNCLDCHGTPNTCNGCHAHGVHSSSSKSDINISATPEFTTYNPGDTIVVQVDGGYRRDWVRVQMWDLDCTAGECTQDKVLVQESNMTTGSVAAFPVALTATAPTEPGTYTWYAGWYGNKYDKSGAAFGLWIPDPNNSNHGNELVAFTFEVVAADPVCGNNIVEGNEQCDDGNTTSGDGCSATCQTETQDCAGTWGGTATEDYCGVCDSDPTNDCTQDCAGTWGGTATADNCGVCDSDPTNDCTQDCAGNWGGTATVDNCGVCDSDPTNDCTTDCNGDPGGTAVLDNCGVCDSDPTNDCTQDCAGNWGGSATVDNCGVCDSDPTNDCTVTPPTGGCSEGDFPVIVKTDYNEKAGKLNIEGFASEGSTITIENADNGQVLAERINVRNDGSWKSIINQLNTIPDISVISSNGCSVDLFIGYHDDDHHDDD